MVVTFKAANEDVWFQPEKEMSKICPAAPASELASGF